MDELTLLRSARSEVADAAPEPLDAGRTALLEHIAAQRGPRLVGSTTRRRVVRRVGYSFAGVAVAAAVVTGLVLSDTVGLAGWRGGADAAAAAVLEDASAAAITSVDPVLAPGQYMRIDTIAAYAGYVPGENGRSFGVMTISEDQLYIPANRDDDWVWMRGLAKPYQSFGAESEAYLQADWARQLAKRGSADYQGNLRAPGGTFYGSRGPRFDDLDTLPRDPHRLLNQIYRSTLGTGPSPDNAAFTWIADTLRRAGVPADLRGAMYGAAARIPGVSVTESAVTLDGQIGVAIGLVDPVNNLRDEIIVDPETGQFIGERQVILESNDAFPAGTVIGWTSNTMTVVDEAPAGGTMYGDAGLPG